MAVSVKLNGLYNIKCSGDAYLVNGKSSKEIYRELTKRVYDYSTSDKCLDCKDVDLAILAHMCRNKVNLKNIRRKMLCDSTNIICVGSYIYIYSKSSYFIAKLKNLDFGIKDVEDNVYSIDRVTSLRFIYDGVLFMYGAVCLHMSDDEFKDFMEFARKMLNEQH